MKQLLIPTNKGGKVVLVKDIIRVEASSSYSKIYFSNERPLLVAKVLQWFEDQLPDDIFCRIHRTHLVSRIHVKEVFNRSSLALSNGDIMQISRRKKRAYKFTFQLTGPSKIIQNKAQETGLNFFEPGQSIAIH
ncbi:MAG: LytTR family DNA-binding domain-containing protein [Ferruginibacter sp.]